MTRVSYREIVILGKDEGSMHQKTSYMTFIKVISKLELYMYSFIHSITWKSESAYLIICQFNFILQSSTHLLSFKTNNVLTIAESTTNQNASVSQHDNRNVGKLT